MKEFDSDLTKSLWIVAFTLFVCYSVYQWYRKRSLNYPPGPSGYPVIGYMLSLGKFPNVTLEKLSKKYGGIFSYKIGPQLIISISDYKLLKEILNHPMVMARPPHAFDFLVGKGGFLGMNGDAWHEQRRFAMSTMRTLGLGKGLWETMIQHDASDFVNEMKETAGKPVPYYDNLSISQISSSLSLLFGRHLDKEKEKEDIEVMRTFGKAVVDNFSSVDITLVLPWITKVVEFLNIKSYREFVKLLRRFELIFKKEVDRRLMSKEELTREDFIGCYLKEMEKKKNETNPHWFNMENLLGNLFILFNAGTDSSIASICWLLLLMVKYPDVQKKVCQEIDQVIGRDGVVYFEDRTKLPYTVSTIQEMLRYISLNPLFPPRYVLEDISFEGYTIPRGAHVIGNNYAIMHNPKYYPDPWTFKPERFLSEDGTKALKPEGYGPFSFGKRNCPGEGVATMSIFLYFVSIMQKFSIRTPEGVEPDMTYKFSSGFIPKPQKLCFLER